MSGDGGADRAPHCLVISDGRRGIENQALGLAEACAELFPLTIETCHVPMGGWLSVLPARWQSRLKQYDLPDCDIAIGCGRRAIPALLKLKRERPGVFTVYVQDPRMNPQAFDLVVAPEHDGLEGPNVITMIGSPNRVTKARLQSAVDEFADKLSNYPEPRAVFLIGGTSKTHRLSDSDHMFHVEQAATLLANGYSLLITTSRRTPDFAQVAWQDFASGHERVWLHDGQNPSEGPNPYFAFLGAANLILVTEDSTNMLTEACATGQPVYRLPMTGKPGKFQMLYDALEERCGVVRYKGQIEKSGRTPLNETERVTQELWQHFDR